MNQWRLMHDRANNGAWNMAVDEAILRAHAREIAPPTLRFYNFEPFCLSLGRLQKQLPPAALETRAQRDFDIVRRPTGGRAVWHAHEITYCAVVREEMLPSASRSVAGAYLWLSEGFLQGLRALGLAVEMAPGGVRTSGSNCFAASASCDFVAGGKKLIGAAQCRMGGAVMQHGSLLLSIEAQTWQDKAGGPMESATSLRDLGADFSVSMVTEALSAGFASAVGASWKVEGLSEQELQLAQTLSRGKYLCDSWTWNAHLMPEEERNLGSELLKMGFSG